MPRRLIELFLNLFGVLLFVVNPLSQKLESSKISLATAIFIFILIQWNIYSVFVVEYFDTAKRSFVAILNLADIVNWIVVVIIVFAEKVIHNQAYLGVVNQVLHLETLMDFRSENQMLKRHFIYGVCLNLIRFAIFPLIVYQSYYHHSVAFICKDLLYNYSFSIMLLSNLFLESVLFYKVILNLKLINSKLSVARLSEPELNYLLSVQFKIVDLMLQLERVCSFAKVFHLTFLFIAVPVYIFHIYLQVSGDEPQNFNILIYWLYDLIVIGLGCMFWEYPYIEVSLF